MLRRIQFFIVGMVALPHTKHRRHKNWLQSRSMQLLYLFKTGSSAFTKHYVGL